MNSALVVAARSLLAWVLAAQLAIGSSWHHHADDCGSAGCGSSECVDGGSCPLGGKSDTSDPRIGVACASRCVAEGRSCWGDSPFAKRRLGARRFGTPAASFQPSRPIQQLSSTPARSCSDNPQETGISSGHGGASHASDCSICRMLGQSTAAPLAVAFEVCQAVSEQAILFGADPPISRLQRRSHSRAPPVTL